MERNRRNSSRKQNMSEDHREHGRMGEGREKRKDVSTLDRPESHAKKAFHPPQETEAEVSKQNPKKVEFSMPVSHPIDL